MKTWWKSLLVVGVVFVWILDYDNDNETASTGC